MGQLLTPHYFAELLNIFWSVGMKKSLLNYFKEKKKHNTTLKSSKSIEVSVLHYIDACKWYFSLK